MIEHIKIADSNKNMMKTLGPTSKRWDAQYGMSMIPCTLRIDFDRSRSRIRSRIG